MEILITPAYCSVFYCKCPAAKNNTQVVQGFSFEQREIKVDIRRHGSSPFLSTSLLFSIETDISDAQLSD